MHDSHFLFQTHLVNENFQVEHKCRYFSYALIATINEASWMFIYTSYGIGEHWKLAKFIILALDLVFRSKRSLVCNSSFFVASLVWSSTVW